MTTSATDGPAAPRAPLDPRLLAGTAAPWTGVEVLEQSPSTNAVLVERARQGEAEGLVVVTDHQTAGRGRLGRTWETPPRAALTFSVLLRPSGVPQDRWPWLTLLAGVAVAEGLRAAGAPPVGLKWPNDVMDGGLKLGGLLAERVDTPTGPAVVLGIGLNVSTLRPELPVDQATSLVLAGMVAPDRTRLLLHVLDALGRGYLTWSAAGGDPADGLLGRYRALCETLGRRVRVQLPSGATVEGTATAVSPDGGLVVDGPEGSLTVTAGDVVHVRPA